jgi:hypothetical protein
MTSVARSKAIAPVKLTALMIGPLVIGDIEASGRNSEEELARAGGTGTGNVLALNGPRPGEVP